MAGSETPSRPRRTPTPRSRATPGGNAVAAAAATSIPPDTVKADTSKTWWNIQEYAAHYGKPVRTVYYWRQIGYGPQAVKVAGELRWHVPEVLAFDAQLRAARPA